MNSDLFKIRLALLKVRRPDRSSPINRFIIPQILTRSSYGPSGRNQAERFFLPFARRRLMIRLPAFVDILFRNPWFRDLLIRLG
jgi:hypothetical protein